MEFTEILVIVLLFISILAVLVLINTLKKLTEASDKICRDISEMKEEAIPALKKLDETLQNTSVITGRLEKRSAEIDSQVEHLRERIGAFSEKLTLQPGSHSPIGDLLSNIRAISQGFSAFWSAFRK